MFLVVPVLTLTIGPRKDYERDTTGVEMICEEYLPDLRRLTGIS